MGSLCGVPPVLVELIPAAFGSPVGTPSRGCSPGGCSPGHFRPSRPGAGCRVQASRPLPVASKPTAAVQGRLPADSLSSQYSGKCAQHRWPLLGSNNRTHRGHAAPTFREATQGFGETGSDPSSGGGRGTPPPGCPPGPRLWRSVWPPLSCCADGFSQVTAVAAAQQLTLQQHRVPHATLVFFCVLLKR